MSQKPNILIFGGLVGAAQPFIQLLVPPHPSEPLVGHIRLRDKYLISPPTTFVAKEFLAFLEERKDIIDYKQANLTNPAAVAACFDEPSPNGQPYTHVLDLSGNVTFTHSATIQIVQTFNVGMNIARESEKHGVKALVRHQPPWYEHLDPAAKYTEADPNGWKPMPKKGVWWHETLRAMGNIPGLPFCVVRTGYVYGPGFLLTEPLTGTLVALIFKHMGQKLTIPWTPSVRKNTLHTDDYAVMLWKVMEWMASTDRDGANSAAGVNLPPTNDPEIPSAPGSVPTGDVIVPVFNAVDEGDTTMQIMTKEVTKVFDVEVEFISKDPSDLQEMSEADFMENVNAVYLGEWTKIIMNSNPPVPHTPLTPYAQTYQFKERGSALDGTKMREMFPFRLKYPRFSDASIRSWIEWCRRQGIWPETHLYP